MLTRPLHRLAAHLQRNVIAYLALTVAIGAGGGYAIPAANTRTIHACVNNHTHALFIQKRCHRGQSAIVWNQQGPQGPQGRAGTPASAAWATVGSDGSVPVGKNISARRTGVGTYAVQVDASACPNNASAPVVTPSGPTPPGAPVASIGGAGRSFTVFTGTVTASGFTAADVSFNVSVPCD
ncbi:MAG TPA: hypothetical protein VEH31_45775 [Streptosporangiaceae bacterium]|nr:hypothetical protein [Streptosporangiaceae bacterium]